MVDNVLLEKRNRYLGKLIQKTQNLTESVKLLSKIDKELYSQSGGRLSTQMIRLSTPVVIHKSGSNNLEGLKNVVEELKKTIDKYREFEMSLAKMPKPVIFVDPFINKYEIDAIIRKIDVEKSTLDKHSIMIITNFLNDTKFKEATQEYVAFAEGYAYRSNPQERDTDELVAAWEKLNNAYMAYKTNITDSETRTLLDEVFKLMYPNPEDNARVSPTAGSSSSAAGAL
jgi:hypothetical protein